MRVLNSIQHQQQQRRGLGGPDKSYADRVQSAWVRFADTGDPNGDGIPAWPRYSEDADELMLFSLSPRVEAGFREDELDFHQSRWDTKNP